MNRQIDYLNTNSVFYDSLVEKTNCLTVVFCSYFPFFVLCAQSKARILIQFLFYQNVSPPASSFIEKETLAQVFSCEFGKIFKNTFFTEHTQATVSERSSVFKVSISRSGGRQAWKHWNFAKLQFFSVRNM